MLSTGDAGVSGTIGIVTRTSRVDQGVIPETTGSAWRGDPERLSGSPPFCRSHASPTLVDMTARRLTRWLSPSLFALTALCFLLPFATVSCDNATTTFSGIQLVTHRVPTGGMLHEAPDCAADISVCVERDASWTAAIALVALVVALVLGLVGVVRGPGWCAGIAFGALLVLPFEGPLLGPDVGLHAGWYLALGLSAVAGCLHVRRAWHRRGRAFLRRITRLRDVPAPDSGGGPLEVALEIQSGSDRCSDDRKEFQCAP